MNPTLKICLIVCVLILITYALADGIRYRNPVGIIMAVVSLLAILVFIWLSKKMAMIEDQEEEEELID